MLKITEDRERKDIESMTDSEKLTEILVLMRGVEDAIAAISKNPMAFLSGMGM